VLEKHLITQEASPALRRVQHVGYILFFGFMVALGTALIRAFPETGSLWAVLAAIVAGYLAADLASGVVHFLADNFGTPETPFIGPGFVLPFRQHHHDPLGITRHGFFEANGNNALVCLPVLVPVVLFVPIAEGRWAYAVGVFSFVMLLAVFLTNQTHKWAHMESVPPLVRWLQVRGLILSTSHHDIHHTSPFDTYYCITVGWWNPLLERLRLFPRLERLIRRWIPGTDPMPRVERDSVAASLTMSHSSE
jgi:hypothetical protein